MARLTFAEAIRQAVEGRGNPALAVEIADRLRARGFDYGRTYHLVRDLTGIELAEWDALLYEGEVEWSR